MVLVKKFKFLHLFIWDKIGQEMRFNVSFKRENAFLDQNRLGKGFLWYSRKETCLFRLEKTRSLISRKIEILQKIKKIEIVSSVYFRQNRTPNFVLRYSRKAKRPFNTRKTRS